MVTLFERLTLIIPPGQFMVDEVYPRSGFQSKKVARECR